MTEIHANLPVRGAPTSAAKAYNPRLTMVGCVGVGIGAAARYLAVRFLRRADPLTDRRFVKTAAVSAPGPCQVAHNTAEAMGLREDDARVKADVGV